MVAHTFPRRATSTPITVTVASATTQLSIEAGLTASNQFRAFTGGGLSTRSAHPVTGFNCDPTEDGQQANGKTAIDWCGKGCYDPVGRRVMWAGTGAEGGVANTPINTMALYAEATNSWSAVRSWATGGETTSTDGTGHTYDSNCIDVSGRRFFKRKFSEDSIYVRDLTTSAWSKLAISGAVAHYGDCGMDYIPSLGRLWIRTRRTSTANPLLLEVNPTTGEATSLIEGGGLGSDSTSVCSFNPRAFGGVGGVFVGGSNAVTVRVDTLVTQSNSTGKPSSAGSFNWSDSPSARNQHVCRDPVGDGWLVACRDGFMWRLTSAGTWTQRAQLPQVLRDAQTNWGIFDFVMVPIDDEAGSYGVVWIVANQGLGAERAWLYRP